MSGRRCRSAAANSNRTIDTRGNITSSDDFNGKRNCSSFDATRNLETVRVEGLANTQACSAVVALNATLPAGSRKTSTNWHPDWPVQTQVAEPGKVTNFVYNGQPDPLNGNAIASSAPAAALLPDGKPIVVLCKKAERATTDADGRLGQSPTYQSGMTNRVRRQRQHLEHRLRRQRKPHRPHAQRHDQHVHHAGDEQQARKHHQPGQGSDPDCARPPAPAPWSARRKARPDRHRASPAARAR